MSIRSRLAGFLGVAALLPTAVLAEDGPSPGRSHAVCWRGKPLPECRSFPLVEVAMYVRVDDPADGDRDATPFTLDLGWMKNVSPKDAVGLAFCGVTEDQGRAGGKLRYRRWLERQLSVDAGVGTLPIPGHGSGSDYRTPGYVASVGVNYGDLIGITYEAERATIRSRFAGPTGAIAERINTEVQSRLGVKVGSTPASMVLGVVGVLYLLLLSTVETS